MSNRRQIHKFVLNDGRTILSIDDDHYFEYSSDHNWVIRKYRDGSIDGKEVERYNCRYIMHIVWV